MSPESNPFSTRFTRPGAIPFRFGDQPDADCILSQFSKNRWLAQIVGPHGSGKTTLVRGLEPELRTQFASIQHHTIRSVRGRIEIVSRTVEGLHRQSDGPNLLVIDGVFLLSRLNRWLLKTWCRKTKTGLLVTVHYPSRWLPTIATLRPEVDTFLNICDWLQRSSKRKLEHATCRRAFNIAGGNYREAFMLLYDQFETHVSHQSLVKL